MRANYFATCFATLLVYTIASASGRVIPRQHLEILPVARNYPGQALYFHLYDEILKRSPAQTTKATNATAADDKKTPVNHTQTASGKKPYYDTLDAENKKKLLEFCDDSATNIDRQTARLLFTQPSLDRLSDSQVEATLAKSCYQYQDKVAPQYSHPTYFDKEKKEPTIQGVFSGGRVPGYKGLYSASCEIEKLSSPKWYDAESEQDRVKQQTNPYGTDSAFTDKWLTASGTGEYRGFTDFCKGAPGFT